nr:HAD family hydrolase [Paenibacillus phyllosphaerae]
MFDLDNTLLNRKQAFERYARYLIEQYAHVNNDDELEAYVASMIRADQNGYRSKKELYTELRDTLPLKDAATTVEQLLQTWFTQFSSFTVHMDGALDILEALRNDGYRLGLITNGSSGSQHGKIDRAGIRHYFDALIVSDDVGVKKPQPAIYAIALERLGLTPEESIYIGDHPINDIQGANAAGLRAVWLEGFMQWPQGGAAHPHVIYHLSELRSLLMELNRGA